MIINVLFLFYKIFTFIYCLFKICIYICIMKLPKHIKNKVEHGDIKLIHESTSISMPTIGNAIRDEKGSRKTIQAIINFYQNN